MAVSVSLMMLCPGTSGRICDVRGCRGTCRRLSDTGLCPNARVEVMEKDRGSLIVKVNCSRHGLSRGMVVKIMVNEDA